MWHRKVLNFHSIYNVTDYAGYLSTQFAELSSYPGHFREPLWLSKGFPEISKALLIRQAFVSFIRFINFYMLGFILLYLGNSLVRLALYNGQTNMKWNSSSISMSQIWHLVVHKAQVVYPIDLSPLWDGDCWLQNGLGILSGRRNGCIEGKPG